MQPIPKNLANFKISRNFSNFPIEKSPFKGPPLATTAALWLHSVVR